QFNATFQLLAQKPTQASGQNDTGLTAGVAIGRNAFKTQARIHLHIVVEASVITATCLYIGRSAVITVDIAEGCTRVPAVLNIQAAVDVRTVLVTVILVQILKHIADTHMSEAHGRSAGVVGWRAIVL